jgi:hypothetical protein
MKIGPRVRSVPVATLAVLGAGIILAQDPFVVAATHYKREFENSLVRVSRVSYQAHDKAPMHDHPALPTVYVYTTDGGAMRFIHDKIGVLTRPAVKAGWIRFPRPAKESHAVEYLGTAPTEYLRIEVKTEPVDIPEHAVRLRPEPHEANSYARTQFENRQFRIVRLWCVAGCPASAHSDDPAVVVAMVSREVRWVEANAAFPWTAGGDYVRIELKGGSSR